MASNQEELPNSSRETRLAELAEMAQRDFPRLVQLFVNNSDRVNFNEVPHYTTRHVYLKMCDAIRSIYPRGEYYAFLRSLRNQDYEDKIMECLMKVLNNATNYIIEQQRSFDQAADWFNRANAMYESQIHDPSDVFSYLQGTFADIFRYYVGLGAMGTVVARHRKVVVYLCSAYVIPEQHNRPNHSAAVWRVREAVRSWMGIVRQFELQCEMLATKYHLLVVRCLMDLRQNA